MNFNDILHVRVEGIPVFHGLLGILQAFRRFMWCVYEIHKSSQNIIKLNFFGRKSISLILRKTENLNAYFIKDKFKCNIIWGMEHQNQK